jgi:hypothetical protein
MLRNARSAQIGSLFGTENRQFLKEVESYGRTSALATTDPREPAAETGPWPPAEEPTIESVMRYDQGLRNVMAQIPRLENEPPGVVNCKPCGRLPLPQLVVGRRKLTSLYRLQSCR